LSTAIGYGTQVAGPSVVIGVGARGDIDSWHGWESVSAGGVAIGDFSSIGGNKDGGVAIGAIAQADQNNSIAIGRLSGATRQYFYRYPENANGKVYKCDGNKKRIVELVFANTLLRPNGTLIIEHSSHTDLSELPHFVASKRYGGCVFSFFEP